MSESIRDVLSKNLKELRKSRGLTQEQLASLAGFQTPSYNKWETGKAWPEPDTISALARALEVEEARLFQSTSSLITPREALKILNEYLDKNNT